MCLNCSFHLNQYIELIFILDETNLLFSQTPLHLPSSENALLLFSALGVDENADDDNGESWLGLAIEFHDTDRVCALLQLNVDTKNVVTNVDTPAAIVQLLGEHRQRSVAFVFVEFLNGMKVD